MYVKKLPIGLWVWYISREREIEYYNTDRAPVLVRRVGGEECARHFETLFDNTLRTQGR
jgi:hypothetical protein